MIALFQGLPKSAAPQANIALIGTAACAAATMGAQLIVFPELFVTGYNIPADAIAQLAEELTGDIVRNIAAIATAHRIAIIFGMPEKAGTAIYNTAVAISANGELLSAYQKIHLFGSEAETFTAGKDLQVFDLNGIKIGLAICYDIEFPEMARELKRKGAQLICVPTANFLPYTEVPTTLVRARAQENALAIAYANLCGTEGDLTYTGLSAIVNPNGVDAARAGAHASALLCTAPFEIDGKIPLATQLDDIRLHRR